MRAALVYAQSPDELAGNVDSSLTRSYVSGLRDQLESDGHEVYVQHLHGDPLHHMGSAISKLADDWSENRPDVVHAHLWTSGLASVAASRMAKSSVPVLFTPHATGVKSRNRKWLRLKAAVAREVDRVAASSSDEQVTLTKIGVRRRDIDVIPHAVDTQVFTPAMTQFSDYSVSRVLAAGPLHPETGFATAIEAIAGLRRVELIIAGGPTVDANEPWSLASDQEANRLREFAKHNGVADRTHLTEMPEREALPELLRTVDVVVCTPWYEQPNTIELEAMACGRPVIGTSVGELRDIIIEGTTGMLVPPRDPKALARALQGLLSDPVRHDGFAMAGVLRARARYDWRRIANDVTHAYERVVDTTFDQPTQ